MRTTAAIIAVFMGLLTILVVLLGINDTIHAIIGFGERLVSNNKEVKVGLMILEALDFFMIALVFLIFTIGIVSLFIKHEDKKFQDSLPAWLKVSSISELKFLVMQSIIATLFIFSLSYIASYNAEPALDWLYLPGSILLLSLALFILMKGESKK